MILHIIISNTLSWTDLYLLNKDNKTKHLYLEVNNSDDRWGACAHQFAMDHPIDAEAGEANMFSKDPKIIYWISNGHHMRS